MKRIICVAAMVLGLAGCATGALDPSAPGYDPAIASAYHPVHGGYDEYLARHRRPVQFPRLSESTLYYLPPRTDQHRRNRRSSQFGRAVVEFGRVLDVTMKGDDVRAALGKVERVTSPQAVDGLLIILALEEYRFGGFRARVGLDISVLKDGKEIISRTYKGVGGRHTGKEIRATGIYALRSSIQASTRDAMDQILERLMVDMTLRLKN